MHSVNPNEGNSCGGTGNQWSSSGGLSGGGIQNPGFANAAASVPSAAANVPSLHEDTIGAHLKSGLAQYVALEISRHSNVKDEDVLHILSPGLLPGGATTGVLDAPQRRGGGKQSSSTTTNTNQQQPQKELQQPPTTISKLSGSLSGGGSFRSVGQSSGGGSFSGGRQLGRGSTTIIFGGGNGFDGGGSDGGSVYSGTKVSPSNAGGGGHISLAVPSVASRSPSIASVLAAPGGVGQQSIMSIGHFALVPTLSHPTRLDAPILQFLPWLKTTPTFMQQG